MGKESTEGKAWRKFLAPALAGLCTLLTAVGTYLSTSRNDSDADRIGKLEARMAVVETKADGIQDMRDELKELSKSINILIGKFEAYQGVRK